VGGAGSPGDPTMRRVAVAAAVAVSLAAATTALALRDIEVKYGNAPEPRRAGWADGVAGVVNLKSRVYMVRSTGMAGLTEEDFYYQGGTRDLSEAVAAFAAVKTGERRLVLLPGRGKVRSFDGKSIDFGWRLHVPHRGHPVLTAHIDAERPQGLPDARKARKWIADLDSAEFREREGASRELGKLGAAAKPLLREALKGSPGLEVRRRIGSLLARLKGTDADDLEVPEGVTVVTPADWLESGLKGLSDRDAARRNAAWGGLVELAGHSDEVVPALAGMVGKGKGDYVRLAAASSLRVIGAGAKAALPALRGGFEDPDENVRAAFRSAAGLIEKAKGERASEEEVKARRAIIKDLDRWQKARGKAKDGLPE
jgi:hypothetical protein